jgi:aryl-alcohol dehydrogenase-like predicted oxidoreductase
MILRNLGNSGLRVSLVGLGCNNFGGRIDIEATRNVVHRALDAGITLFDTADTYGDRGGSESALGEILGPRRKDIVLATKFAMPMDDVGVKRGASRRYIMTAVEDSLKRLRTDHIDLYQQHNYDPLTPIEETLRALDDLIHQGKVRYVGCSNLPAWRVVEAQLAARAINSHAFVSCQEEYSLVARGIEKDMLPAMQAYRMGLLPFFPLASGLLTGKYSASSPAPKGTRFEKWPRMRDRFGTDRNVAIAERLDTFARERGHTLIELAFSWLAHRPQVASVIAGATRPEQIDQNVAAAGWKLSDEEIAEVDEITA